MGLAFGHRLLGHGGGGGECRQTQRLVQQPRGRLRLDLAGVMAELLLEAPAPAGAQPIADFVEGGAAPAAATLDQPGVAAMLAGQQRDDDVVLAMAPDRQDETLVMPFQAGSS